MPPRLFPLRSLQYFLTPRLILRTPLSPILPTKKAQLSTSPGLNAWKSDNAEIDQEEIDKARKFLQNFDAETIPKSICDISFSRSSGPGGQNVNKVNSKATLRIPLQKLLPLLPTLLQKPILTSRYIAQKSNDLVIQSDDSRKQTDNTNGCFAKLRDLVLETGGSVVPGESGEGMGERVQKLQKAENEGRLKMKRKLSDKKSARRGKGKPDY